MAVRKIDAPGIEVNQIDRSAYDTMTDYSIVGTTSFICGFSDKGENYKINWINSKSTLVDVFGYPTNEFEQIFYNANLEILNNGGVLLAAKLPYDNISLTSYSACEYQLEDNNGEAYVIDDNDKLSSVLSVDPTISTYIKIKNTNNSTNGLISQEDFDNLRTGKTKLNNSITIVDISKKQYDSINIASGKTLSNNIECLGIMPMIVSPTNAMYFQKLIHADTKLVIDERYNENIEYLKTLLNGKTTEKIENVIEIEKTDQIETYSPIGGLTTKNMSESLQIDLDVFSTRLSADSIYDNSISKLASETFPYINNISEDFIDRTYLKQIGVVVLNVYKDTAASNSKINFEILESYVGSLDKNARDQATKQSIFIDNIINTNSKYINFFSGFNTNKHSYINAETIHISQQIGKVLGFFSAESTKKISYKTSILDALNIIFDNAKDPNVYPIDLVIDAGVSNIAMIAQTDQQTANLSLKDITLPKTGSTNVRTWKAVLQKYDTFVKNIRKDCMFIADGHRGLCLEGDEKIVRYTQPTYTVDNQILPRLKYLVGLNSSYSAGYCNWFKTFDAYTGDQFWCPPSIKAAGIYLYTDTYYNVWDAPAGLNRGIVRNIIDCAFTPTIDEAGKIYSQQWNYAINYPIQGIALEGQKTFQVKKTAFDRINVRRLFLSLEKSVSRIARFFVYEGNTAYLRQRFVDNIRPILENAKEKNGILEYYILCNDTNNTPQTIDNNELHCTIAIKPVKTIEFIVLNFICTNQSSNVTEVLQ